MLSKDRQILEAALSALRRTTGVAGMIVRDTPSQDRGHDAVVQIGTEDEAQVFAATVKAMNRFHTPALIKAQFADSGHSPLLVAPYITRETAEQCRAIQLPFLDTAGNAFLAHRVSSIYFYVHVVGERRPRVLKQDISGRAVTATDLQSHLPFHASRPC
jgi:hypothetical protein